MEKRRLGQYYTINNPFILNPFKSWASEYDIKSKDILEPFAGANNIIRLLEDANLCNQSTSFDIMPADSDVIPRDTLLNFPTGFKVCITNPPYLAKNSAKRRGLNCEFGGYDDLYKFALDKCLQNCEYVGAIIPASFINSNLFTDRLCSYILLNNKMFNDTEHPVCLALFKSKSLECEVYYNSELIGTLSELRKKLPNPPEKKAKIVFNNKHGEVGLHALDNTKEASIRFVEGHTIPSEVVGFSSRSITRISIEGSSAKGLLKDLNDCLKQVRTETKDVFLTPFKGLREDGMYRRRLDWELARRIINACV